MPGSWTDTDFELHVKQRLTDELSSAGDPLWARYVGARDKVAHDIASQIQGAEPDLSDHSAEHIRHVLDNCHLLLSSNRKLHKQNAVELYLLAMSVLFHDVGNIFGRSGHHMRVAEVYDWACGKGSTYRHERTLVLSITRAHTGTASDTSLDTLKELSETDNLHKLSVRPRNVAAILRLADELAEGPIRTSEFRRQQGMIDPHAKIYHDYASVTHVQADRGTERVSITYEIDLDDKAIFNGNRWASLRALLDFVYHRIVKLNQERQYARFYSDTLAPFKATEVVFNFHHSTGLVADDLQSLRLDDKIVPGDQARSIDAINPAYKLDELVDRIRQHIEGEEA